MTIHHFDVAALDFDKAGQVSSQIKKMVKEYGFDPVTVRRIAVATYEAEINLIIHSHGGRITLSYEAPWLYLIFKDIGPGIPDLEKAMQPGWSTASKTAQAMGFGAGLGLTNIQKNSDTFHLTSDPSGTTLEIGFKKQTEVPA
jgi:anti-sigma regulatory factor (Ser/Thr protein kinase)